MAAQHLISTQAKEDKARYDAALKAAGVLTKAEKKAQGPKRPLSAYMHFCAERRPSLTEELKAQLGAEFKYTLVMTKLGEEWRGVGDKSKYEAMAAAERAVASDVPALAPRARSRHSPARGMPERAHARVARLSRCVGRSEQATTWLSLRRASAVALRLEPLRSET